MTHKLIKTDNYLLVVDDSEIKQDDWYKTPLGIYSQFNGTEKLLDGTKKVAAHLPLNGSPILKGVDFLPNIEDDVEQLADEYGFQVPFNGTNDFYNKDAIKHYKQGYNKAREKYKYTEEDVIRIAEKSRIAGLTAEYLMLASQYPTEFECEMTGIDDFPTDTPHIKTTTNAQGQRVWVGKYK